jgi:hypothetical protein
MAKQSKSSQMRERERRCDSLYWHRRMSAPEICDVLADEKLFDEKSSPAASLKWVQERVKAIREGAEPDRIIRLQRPAETERYTQGLTRLLNVTLDIIEDQSVLIEEVTLPTGDVKTRERMKVSEDVRVKAIARAESLVEKIGLVNMVAVKGGDGSAAGPEDPDKPKADAKAFVFNMSGKPVDELIADRTGKGSVN